MIITEEKLDYIYFGCTLSSGPPVLICYSITDDDVYSSFYYKHDVDDILIFKFETMYHSTKTLKEDLRKSIENFVSPRDLRDQKIDKVLGTSSNDRTHCGD